MSRCALWALVCGGLLACDPSGSTPGLRGPCSTPSGEPLGCDEQPIETAEDACWKLVSCGAIPVANPDDDPDCCFDYTRCIDELGELEQLGHDFALACIEGATCDQLRWRGSPDRPTRNRAEMPACLQHGDS